MGILLLIFCPRRGSVVGHYLLNKQIIVGITGGIAAYKSADLVRRLRDEGAKVRVVMTKNAKEFITPLTMQAVSGHPVYDDLFSLQAEAAMGHIELARWADIVLIAPASANFMSELKSGGAKDLLTTICLATKAPIALAPSMNQVMWETISTQNTIAQLKDKKILIWGPGVGSQVCGEFGPGRMLEPLDLVEQIAKIFANKSLSGKRILITAGPTREALDPVRYISNISSGKMGYALAQAAREAGASVTLISGPVILDKPQGMQSIDVISAEQMFDAVMTEVKSNDIFISAAAVSDYRAMYPNLQKINKIEQKIHLELVRNPDIVSEVANLKDKPIVIGFAAETENLIENAKAKYHKKNLDMVIANQVGKNLGFERDDNSVVVLWRDNQRIFPLMPKQKLARELIILIGEFFGERKNG